MAGDVLEIERLFQEGKTYEGKEKRTAARGIEAVPSDFKHSVENTALLRDMAKIARAAQPPHICTMPKQIQENAIGIVNAVEEIGGDSFKQGVEVSRDTVKQGREFFKFNKGLLKTALTWIIYTVIVVSVVLVVSGKVSLRLGK